MRQRSTRTPRERVLAGSRATPRDTAVAAVAARQHGVVARRQLLELGLDDGAIARRRRAGRLHGVHPGVFAVGHPLLSPEGRWLAAVLACGDGAVLGHASAAALWGIRPTAAARVDVTVPRASGVRSSRLIRVRRPVGEVEATVCRGIPATTVARTLADLAATITRRALEKALEDAEGLRLLDMRELERLAAAHPTRPGPRRTLAAAAALESASTTTRSALEEALLELCDAHRLPRPRVNARVEGLEVDASWPGARLVVELDSLRHHHTRRAFERDRARDARLAAAGWRVIRLTRRALRDDADGVADLLRRASADALP